MRILPVFGGISLLACTVAAVAESKQESAVKLAESPLSGGVFFETILGLVLVLGLIFAMAWAVRKFGRLPLQGKGEIEIEGGVSLGPRERAVLLKVGDTRLLVGVAPGRVQALHVLGSSDETPVPDEPSPEFSRQLKEQIEGQGS
ncbi:MAG: flagellar biosynthetic protein FliO [Candidatus Sedimenticola sp. PURPLELP]